MKFVFKSNGTLYYDKWGATLTIRTKNEERAIELLGFVVVNPAHWKIKR